MTSYGDTLLTIHNNGWVNFISWSPSANLLAFATHDCELNFIDVSSAAGGKSKAKPDKLMLKINPLLSGIFIEEDKFIGAGFDKVPYLFSGSGADWKNVKPLDDGVSVQRKAKITNNKFKDMKVYFNPDIKLSSSIVMKETDTRHANFINCMQPFGNGAGKPTVLSTSDVNGYLNWWDVQNL